MNSSLPIIKVVGVGLEGNQTLSSLNKLYDLGYLSLDEHTSYEERKKIFQDTDLAFILASENERSLSFTSQVALDLGVLSIIILIGSPCYKTKWQKKRLNEIIKKLQKTTDSIFSVSHEQSGMPAIIIKEISKLVKVPGIVKVSFSDIQTALYDKGLSKIGFATGQRRHFINTTIEAIKMIIYFEKATSIIVNITGNEELTLSDVNLIIDTFGMYSHNDANIVIGAVIDSKSKGVSVTIIATGFEAEKAQLNLSNHVVPKDWLN